jgi:beta-N-acetylhexosaminidase
VVSHDRERLRAVELAPFAALTPRLPAMMSAHVVFGAWDAGRPATLSPTVIAGLLRQELGFTGLVLSDDLEMKAVAGRFSPEDLAVACVEAGVDVLCTCHDRARQERMLAALVRRCAESEAFAAQVDAAAARVARFKERWVAGRPPPDPDRAVAAAADPRHHALAVGLARPAP